MRTVIAFALGVLFGLGLYLGGMTDPGKVVGFLDVFGSWDPSLAFVMGGAVSIGLIAFRIVSIRETRLAGCSSPPPSAQTIDRKLLLGATIFGLGWGLSGICPGPAVFNLGLFDLQAVLFFLGMLLGMATEWALPFFGALDSVQGRTRRVSFYRPSGNSWKRRHDWQLLRFNARPTESQRIGDDADGR